MSSRNSSVLRGNIKVAAEKMKESGEKKRMKADIEYTDEEERK